MVPGVFWFRCQSGCPSPSGGSSGAPAFLLEAHLSEKKEDYFIISDGAFCLLASKQMGIYEQKVICRETVKPADLLCDETLKSPWHH